MYNIFQRLHSTLLYNSKRAVHEKDFFRTTESKYKVERRCPECTAVRRGRDDCERDPPCAAMPRVSRLAPHVPRAPSAASSIKMC